MNSHAHIIPSKNIDRLKWDDCIRTSSFPCIYAYAFYLDCMTDNWNGIVLGDYEAVMPVPWRKKYGIRYTYDVPFIQQLGWFGKNEKDYAEIFPAALFSFTKYGSYSFNEHNNVGISQAGKHNNFIINLSASYRSVSKKYTGDVINNLKKSTRFNLSYQPCNYQNTIDLYVKEYTNRFKNTSDKDYNNFVKLCKTLQQQQQVLARQVVDENTGIVLSAALLLKDEQRLYNMMNTTVEMGRTQSANYFLLDNIFKEFAGGGLVFDFEGSDITGIKLFYQKWGAINQPYKRLEKFNRLPFPLNMLER